jgi:hypothetical protein
VTGADKHDALYSPRQIISEEAAKGKQHHAAHAVPDEYGWASACDADHRLQVACMTLQAVVAIARFLGVPKSGHIPHN